MANEKLNLYLLRTAEKLERTAKTVRIKKTLLDLLRPGSATHNLGGVVIALYTILFMFSGPLGMPVGFMANVVGQWLWYSLLKAIFEFSTNLHVKEVIRKMKLKPGKKLTKSQMKKLQKALEDLPPDVQRKIVRSLKKKINKDARNRAKLKKLVNTL